MTAPIHPDSPTKLPDHSGTSVEDETARAARVADPAIRSELLAEADALRAGTPVQAARARVRYLALRDHLDPSLPPDAARIRFVFESSSLREPEVEALAARAEGAPDGELRTLARLVRAEAASDLGRPAEAEDRFRELLVEHRGSGTTTELRICRDLAWFYLMQFREVEALALARRTVALAGAGVLPAELHTAHSCLCGAYRALSDWGRLEEALVDLEEVLREAPPGAWKTRTLLHGYRAEAALERRSAEEARGHLAALRGVLPREVDDGFDHRWPLHLEAAIALEEGRWEDGREAVGRAMALPGRVPSGGLRLALLELGLVLAGEGPAAALPLARRLLGILEAAGTDRYGPGNRLRFGTALGNLFRDRLGSPPDAGRAFDLAAGAVLRRLVQVDRAAREMPEFAALTPEDLRILADYRRNFLSAQRDLSIAAGVLLEQAIAAGRSPLPELASGEGMVAVCAWCRRVRDRKGAWIPVGTFLPQEDSFRITHGICPDCLRSTRPRRA